MSAKLPRVNTLAPAGVWNLLSLCQLATWRWAGLKECVMSEVVGDRGCIYPEGVCRGHWPKGALEAEKSEGKRKGVPRCPSAVPHPNGPRLLCSFIFFLLQTGFFVPISVPLAPTTSPKPVTHGPLEVPQLVAPEGSARSIALRRHGSPRKGMGWGLVFSLSFWWRCPWAGVGPPGPAGGLPGLALSLPPPLPLPAAASLHLSSLYRWDPGEPGCPLPQSPWHR